MRNKAFIFIGIPGTKAISRGEATPQGDENIEGYPYGSVSVCCFASNEVFVDCRMTSGRVILAL